MTEKPTDSTNESPETSSFSFTYEQSILSDKPTASQVETIQAFTEELLALADKYHFDALMCTVRHANPTRGQPPYTTILDTMDEQLAQKLVNNAQRTRNELAFHNMSKKQ